MDEAVLTIKDDLKRVRQLVLDGLGNYPAKVYLFGSRATGHARRASDIDVAVWSLVELPVGTLALIREALEESLVPFNVDLVDLRDTDEGFRARVVAEGIAWHEPMNV